MAAAKPDPLVLGALVVASAGLFGYGTFSSSVTLDEPVLGGFGQRQMLELWVSLGRWGMGLLSLLVPWSVAPGVLGVVGATAMTAAVWLYARCALALPPWTAVFVGVAALSFPGLALHLSFMTNAVGLGVGCLLVALIAVGVVHGCRWWWLAAAAVLLVAIYQSFAVALVVAALVDLARDPRRSAARAWGLVIGIGVAGYVSGDVILRQVLGVDRDRYIADTLDPGLIVTDPAGGLVRAWSFIVPGQGVVDLGAPWPAMLFVVLIATAVTVTTRADGGGGRRAVAMVCLVGLFLAPAAAATITDTLYLRSMVYVPFLVVGLAGLARPLLRPRWAVGILAALCLLTTTASSVVVNRALLAAEIALAHDRHLAFRIDEERRRFFSGSDPIPTYVLAEGDWPTSPMAPPLEHLGDSMLTGQVWRAPFFLASQGVPARPVSTDEGDRLRKVATSMPSYPDEGWVADVDGVLVAHVELGSPATPNG